MILNTSNLAYNLSRLEFAHTYRIALNRANAFTLLYTVFKNLSVIMKIILILHTDSSMLSRVVLRHETEASQFIYNFLCA